MDAMLNLLSSYLEKDIELMGLNQSEHYRNETGSSGSVEDVIVKVILFVIW